jgi:hypothetical protein
MAFSTIAAITGALSAAGGLYSTISANNRAANQKQAIAQNQTGDAYSNEVYQRAIQALVNNRSVSGYQDSFGTSIQYDPATNQWVSSLGPLPQQEQTAASQAAISRNTTDLRQAQAANEQAALRAARAEPAADAAQRDLSNYTPMSGDTLAALMRQRVTESQNQTYNPLIADTLREFQRTGSAAGDVLGKIGRDQATSLRQGLLDAQIAGMTNASNINNQRLQGLEGRAATTASLASPQFQYSGIVPSDQAKTLATLAASRAQTGATAPAYAQRGVNDATTIAGQAATGAESTVPPSNLGATEIGSLAKQIGDYGSSDNLKKLISLFGSGSSTPTVNNTNNPYYMGQGGDS